MAHRMLSLIILAVLLLLPQAASATVDVDDDIRISLWAERPSGQSQGPFWAEVYDDDAPTISPGALEQSFLTFCVETTQYFSPGSTYNIDAITTASTIGRELTGYTAWVYQSFQDLVAANGPWDQDTGPTGTYSGYGWGTVMNLYQNAVWAGMVTDGATTLDDIGGPDAELEVDVDGAAYQAIGISAADFLDSTWGGTASGDDVSAKLSYVGDFRILNVETGSGGSAQDQMFLVPDGIPTPIPEPGSLAIWSMISLGAAGVTGLARRRRRQSGTRCRWSEENREAILSVIEGRRHA